ncbi:MAG TPA: hypothetical protein VNT22_06085 [Baekduia sp.]|nr:hypothetical protein [Baekduia sp.]
MKDLINRWIQIVSRLNFFQQLSAILGLTLVLVLVWTVVDAVI